MHYVWQYRLIETADLHTVDGRRIAIIDPGRHNTDAGPDFFNAKIKIAGRLWAGDIEMHVRASDWHRHHHDNDPAYDSVILHVVDNDDTSVTRRNGETIPQMALRCSPEFHRRYDMLVSRSDIDLPCAPSIPSLPPLVVTDWLTALAYERAYAKADRITELLDRNAGDWEQTAYVTLARAFGFSTNALPMERLALSVPLRILRRHSDSLTSIEALLFGQAGLLDGIRPGSDRYADSLKKEYDHLARKYSIKPLEAPGWKMARMRPQNQPHRRIATLAAIICEHPHIAATILSASTPDQAIDTLLTPLTGYWAERYTLAGPPSERPHPSMSRTSATSLVINVAIPLMIAHGSRHGDSSMTQRAFEWLTSLPPESNTIIDSFRNAGIPARNALDTQALIQLRRQYCERHSCIYCRIGHRLLSRQAKRT